MTQNSKVNHTVTDELLLRNDLVTIRNMIPDGARILDLGCGSGRLLKALKIDKNAKVLFNV